MITIYLDALDQEVELDLYTEPPERETNYPGYTEILGGWLVDEGRWMTTEEVDAYHWDMLEKFEEIAHAA